MKLLAFGLLCLSISSHAWAGPSCELDAKKFMPTFNQQVRLFLKENIDFPWNSNSLKIKCEYHSCHVTFRAEDGTLFTIKTCMEKQDGLVYCDENGDMNFYIDAQRATNKEGNYEGSTTCSISFYENYINVVNNKTNVDIYLSDKSSTITGFSYLKN